MLDNTIKISKTDSTLRRLMIIIFQFCEESVLLYELY
jgi:hypothetical protein